MNRRVLQLRIYCISADE